MNDMMQHGLGRAEPSSAFRFTGSWREFAPIAFTNLLLTIVTLGIYRFWARARERRYLWARTDFIDDALEWTGTGLEMFKGFVLVMVILVPTLLFLQFGLQAMILRGQAPAAITLGVLLYAGIFYLTGVARYRALRYRLSRTYWHGIRGGGDSGGWGYGWQAFWRTAVGASAAGMLIPWSMTSLWNRRWRSMSFGPHRFEADAEFSPLMGRWLLMIFSPFILLIVGGIIGGMLYSAGAFGPTGGPPPSPMAGFFGIMALVLAFYAGFAILGVGYYAKYARETIGSTRLGDLHFSFSARSMDWFKLFLGSVGLVIVTLGVGLIFLSYRNWSFFIRHLEASGTVELNDLTQSPMERAGDAEGLASAFDIGAI